MKKLIVCVALYRRCAEYGSVIRKFKVYGNQSSGSTLLYSTGRLFLRGDGCCVTVKFQSGTEINAQECKIEMTVFRLLYSNMKWSK
jgi:hypothetical protein